MKKSVVRRPLTALLALLMVISLFTVCGFGAAADDTKELPLKLWNAKALSDAAIATGTVNDKGNPIFHTYTECYGRRSIDTTNYFIHNARVPHMINNSPLDPNFYNGQTVMMIIHLIADNEEDYTDGNLCSFDIMYDANNSHDTYKYEQVVDYDSYMAAPTQVDPEYGYEYKEFTVEADLEGDIFDDIENNTMEMRCISRHTEVSTIVYSMEMIDLNTDRTMAVYYGDEMSGLPGVDGTYENLYTGDDIVAGIASYAGPEDPAVSGRPYPFNTYNADGQRAINKPGTPLLIGLGIELPAGEYVYDFYQSTHFSLGVQKCKYFIMDGDEELASLYLDKAAIDSTVGSDSAIFEHRRVPFVISPDRAGHTITVKIDVYNSTDYKLKNAQLYMVVPSDAEAPDDAKAVIDQVNALTYTDDTAAARNAYQNLDIVSQAWANYENVVEKMDAIDAAQSDAAAVNDAIAAIPDVNDITKDNYTEAEEAVAAAEAAVAAFNDAHGEEAAALISDADRVSAARNAVDAAKKEHEDELAEQEKQAAIQDAKDKITAIGEVTAENYTEKKDPIEAAEKAVTDLKSKYGDEIAQELDTETLDNARKAYDDFVANEKPDVTFGDINADEAINASDALLALQHSVKLITLDDTQSVAADVNGDDAINASDALLILQYSVKLITSFPVEAK